MLRTGLMPSPSDRRHRTLVVVAQASMKQLQVLADQASVPMTRMFEAVVQLGLASPGVRRRMPRLVRNLAITDHQGTLGPRHRTTVVLARDTYRALAHLAVDEAVPVKVALDALLELALQTKSLVRAAVPLAQQIESEYRTGTR